MPKKTILVEQIMAHCTVCKKDFQSAYCPNCGQQKVDEKISPKSVFLDLLNNIYAVDKSFIANLVNLFKRPEFIVNNYLNGYRKYYFSPGKLFLLASLALVISFSFTNKHFFALNVVKPTAEVQLFLLLFFIVEFSAASKIVYRKWQKNFTEHLIINMYTVSLWAILMVPLAVVDYLYFQINWLSWFFLILYFLLILIWNAKVMGIRKIGSFVLFVFLNLLVLAVLNGALVLISMF